MKPYYADATVRIFHGDCLDVLRDLPDASVDAVVTDPPYGLEFMGKEWDAPWKAAEVTRAQGRDAAGLTTRSDGSTRLVGPMQDTPRFDLSRTALRGFQDWCHQWATECLRVLKPGGHMLAFGGTRTSHRLACAVEDAGFEIRDSIAWLYGSGFPKSLDVSKAIDKVAHVNDEMHRRITLVAEVIRAHREVKGMERSAVSLAVVGTPSGACWNWEHQQLPSVDMWPAIKRVLDIPDEFDGLIEGDRAQFIAAERAVLRERTMTQGGGTSLQLRMGEVREVNADITAPATDAARTWQGWGTALKPAHEPIVVARKPLAGTVAANVLAHGTGALNVDGCRVGRGEGDRTDYGLSNGAAAGIGYHGLDGRTPYDGSAGRWPANVVLDESQAAALDAQSGESASTSRPRHNTAEAHNRTASMGSTNADWTTGGHDDAGGASRFMYVAKAAADERPFAWRLTCNCETVKPCAETLQPRATDDSRSATGRSWSTSTSGSSTTGAPSPQDTTSTTSTATNSTTIPPTSCSSPSSTTSASTPAVNSVTGSGGSPALSARTSSPSPSNTGTSAPKAGRSTAGAAHATSRGLSATSVCESCGAPTKREAHATVKPLALMRWLVRLVTPPGGTVLEPFAGSGTTVEACILEGFACIAIEREADYLPLIRQRIHRRRDPVEAVRGSGEDAGLFDLLGGEPA